MLLHGCCTKAPEWSGASYNTLRFTCKLLDFRVGLPGLEPGTSSLSEKRSNRLSYRPEAEVAAGIIYITEVILTSRLNTGEAGSTIGTVSESHYASRCERSI